MIRGLYSAASGLNAMSVMQDVTARNISNAAKPGYLRHIVKFEANGASQEIRGTKPSVHTDFTPGPIVATDNPLDLAINGPGFFIVEGPNGPMYTRSGTFQPNRLGQVVTPEGFALLDAQGRQITLPPDAVDVSVLDDGSVNADGLTVGRVAVAQFDDPSQLTRIGTSVFQPPNGVEPNLVPADIRSGYREMSNASHISEMVQLISGYRHFEAAQRALRALDESIASRTSPRSG